MKSSNMLAAAALAWNLVVNLLVCGEEIQVPRVTLEKALKTPAEDLAQTYLWVNNTLPFAELANLGATTHTDLDGRTATVTTDNAKAFVVALNELKNVCATAIQTRGFAELGKTHDATICSGCDQIAIDAGPTLVMQDGFQLTVTQGGRKHSGVVVESSIAIQHGGNSGVMLLGKCEDGKLVLNAHLSGVTASLVREPCTLTLTENKSPGKEFAKAFVGRGVVWFQAGHYDRAQSDLDEALRLDEEFFGAHNIQAQLLAMCPDPTYRNGPKAVEHAKRACELSQWKQWGCIASLAAAYGESGDFTNAVDWANKAITLAPEHRREDIQDHLEFYRAGEAFHVEAVVGEAPAPIGRDASWAGRRIVPKEDATVRIGDKQIAAGEILFPGVVLREEGEWLVLNGSRIRKSDALLLEEAEIYYEKLIADHGESTGRLLLRGTARLHTGDVEAAHRDLAEAVRLDPCRASAYVNRGITWIAKNDFDAAIADFTKALRLDPSFAAAFHHRGKAWHKKSEFDKAIEDYSDAIRLAPNDADVYADRAETWHFKREVNNAIKDCGEALRIHPDSAQAYKIRGLAFLDKRDMDAAIRDFTQAIRIEPTNSICFWLRGHAQGRRIKIWT